MNSGSRLAGSDASMSSFSSSVRVMRATPSPSCNERAILRGASRAGPYSDSSPDVKGTCVTGGRADDPRERSAARHRRMVEHHHLVDERGPVLADHLDMELLGELRAFGPGLDAHQARAGVDLRAGADRAHEAELVRAVVGRVPVAGELPAGASVQAGEEAQCQEAVRDRAAERALPLGTLHVDVDPLVVPGELGEAVDHVLRDLDRLAPRAEGVANLALEPLDVVETDLFHDGVLPAERPGRRAGPVLPTRPAGRTEGPLPPWRGAAVSASVAAVMARATGFAW